LRCFFTDFSLSFVLFFTSFSHIFALFLFLFLPLYLRLYSLLLKENYAVNLEKYLPFFASFEDFFREDAWLYFEKCGINFASFFPRFIPTSCNK